MANKMLIDAAHPEETRVVVVRGNRIEEFDFEAASKKQLRGNIYLARVTRVEPSLQAAFVDYGGNRHGFLAFSEIHPDYYQIPVADRQALLDEEAEEAAAEAAADEPNGQADIDTEDGKQAALDARSDEVTADGDDAPDGDDDADDGDEDNGEAKARGNGVTEVADDDNVESVGSEDALEEVPQRRAPRRRRSYKIQEVIKRKQILLVQVVKEERGNKGAALTTYLSLAGRYCVLMPNTARGGGISRKITTASDRKRLKDVARGLDVPEGMGVILRTAGASRTKAEIKRDFEYLLRLWENVRELTLTSMAPTLVYEEGNLVKRAIRDLYNKDIDEVLVAGEQPYREAKDFMRMLMPSHAKNVHVYKEPEPVFVRYGVEGQLDAMFSPEVKLKSGGYVVINQTEALVAIDVNSGKATREHSIEETALKTNLEAAAEISRQLRLRDLAGLIVIDFIDMEEKRNNRAVERKLKECLKSDRARIQVGRISHFGLLEMSRQRIRSGIMEGSFEVCPHCQGTGVVRSVSSVALHVLRAIEEEMRRKPADLSITTQSAAAVYILNEKRDHLSALEQRFGVHVTVHGDDAIAASLMTLERHAPSRGAASEARAITAEDAVFDNEADDESAEARDGEGGGKRRRRRRKRRGDGETAEAGAEAASDAEETAADAEAGDGDSEDGGRKRRRRGRRGGRRRRGQASAEATETPSETDADAVEADSDGANEAAETPEVETQVSETPVSEDASASDDSASDESVSDEPAPKRRRRRKAAYKDETAEQDAKAEPEVEATEEVAAEAEPEAEAVAEPDEPADTDAAETAAEPVPNGEDAAPAEAAPAETADAEAGSEDIPAEPDAVPEEAKSEGPPKRGWWNRPLG